MLHRRPTVCHAALVYFAHAIFDQISTASDASDRLYTVESSTLFRPFHQFTSGLVLQGDNVRVRMALSEISKNAQVIATLLFEFLILSGHVPVFVDQSVHNCLLDTAPFYD
ncbi:hypothetical protein T4E_9866 [Trichinella pseudospiralis]|uniref:Uncharacterized protein n=1 Tax=Trichinella pseudospiralis TaxID=6337 RepID=A0A0V0XZI6_TRIPS|nr:hypothetical protein T4E_9866 [Trichinella pseudospiralis]